MQNDPTNVWLCKCSTLSLEHLLPLEHNSNSYAELSWIIERLTTWTAHNAVHRPGSRPKCHVCAQFCILIQNVLLYYIPVPYYIPKTQKEDVMNWSYANPLYHNMAKFSEKINPKWLYETKYFLWIYILSMQSLQVTIIDQRPDPKWPDRIYMQSTHIMLCYCPHAHTIIVFHFK